MWSLIWVVCLLDGLSSGWSLIRGSSSGWSLIRMAFSFLVFHLDGPLIKVVSHQGDHSSGWSFVWVVCHLDGLSSGWSFIRVITHQGGLSSEWFSSGAVLSPGWSFIRWFLSGWFVIMMSFIRMVSRQGVYPSDGLSSR